VKTSEVLRKAGDVLRERGWCQGNLEEKGRVCLLGATGIAAHGYPSAPDSNEVHDALRLVIDRWPIEWNDARGRTQAEVESALDAAYVLALQDEGEDLDEYEVL
jgi:hypothetical protein